MSMCSIERPWGVHPRVGNDENCPRCGWTAPGPRGDAREATSDAMARAADLGWAVLDGGSESAEAQALAA